MRIAVEVLVRALAGFLALGHLLGVAMFLSTAPPLAFAVPAALLIVALRPTLTVAIISVALGTVGYIVGGVPFLAQSMELDVRLLHIAELLFLAGLCYRAVAKRVPWHTGS